MAKSSYFPAIDGLRLLASLNIVFLHLASSEAFTYGLAQFPWLKPIVSGPAFSAGLFFVLAGFLFASKFSDPDRRISVVPFMFSRIAKLYRLHFICTLLMFVAVSFKYSGLTGIPDSVGDVFAGFANGVKNMEHPIRSLLLHLSLLWSLVPDLGLKLNEPSWALTGFFICYAFTPAAARFLFKLNSVKLLWGLLILSFIPGILQGLLFGNTTLYSPDYGARFRFFHMFPAMHLCEYFFGMIIFRLYQEKQFDFLNKNFVAGICQALLLAALYISCYAGQNWVKDQAAYFIVRHSIPILIGGFFIMSLIPAKGFLARFFCVPIVRTVGRASFYPYLLHLPLITIGWGFTDMNTPRATLILIAFLYTASPLYLSFKTRRKKARLVSRAGAAAK